VLCAKVYWANGGTPTMARFYRKAANRQFAALLGTHAMGPNPSIGNGKAEGAVVIAPSLAWNAGTGKD